MSAPKADEAQVSTQASTAQKAKTPAKTSAQPSLAKKSQTPSLVANTTEVKAMAVSGVPSYFSKILHTN